jgi:hypothetical protein
MRTETIAGLQTAADVDQSTYDVRYAFMMRH